MLEWVIFYENGTTFSNEDGPPEDSPIEGVLAIAQKDRRESPTNCGFTIIYGETYFIYCDGQWWNHDQFAFFKKLEKHNPTGNNSIQAIRFGIYTTNAIFDLVMERASELNLPNKSAKHHTEK